MTDAELDALGLVANPKPKRSRVATAKRKNPEGREKTEDEIHREIAQNLPKILHPDVVWWSNESRCVGAREGKRRKDRGVKAGTPDMEFHWHNGQSLFIELKRKGSYPSADQKDMHASLKKVNHTVDVCRSLDEVIEKLKQTGVPMRIK